MENKELNLSQRGKKMLRLRWLPVIVLIMGLFSIVLMVFTEKIGREKRLNYLHTDTVHEIQIELSKAYVIIEDHLKGNSEREIPEAVQRMHRSTELVKALLEGGVTVHGFKANPIESSSIREEVKALGDSVDSFGLAAGEFLETHSPDTQKQVSIRYYEFLKQAYSIDEKLEAIAKQNQTDTNRLFVGAITSWTAILILALAGLLLRERQKTAFEKAIINAKREWEHTFDVIPDLIAVIDKDHRIARVNKAMADLVGRKPGEILGRQCHEIFHGSERSLALCPHAKMLQDEKNHTFELYEKTFDVYYLVSVSPLYDDEGRLLGSVHVARDISEQKKTAETLKVKDSAIESSINAIGIGDLNNRISYVNPALLRLWGYRAEELLGQSPEFLGRSVEEIKEVMDAIKSQGVWTGELVARKKDGTLFYVELSANLVKDNAGKPLCLMVSFIDISWRKTVERELQTYKEQLEEMVVTATGELNSAIENLNAEVLKHRQTEEALLSSEGKFREVSQQFNILLDAIPDSLILMSADLKVLWANRGAIDLLAEDGGEITGQYCHTLWHDQDMPCDDCPVLKSFSSGKPEMTEASTSDGRLWATRAYPIRNEQGTVMSVMEISTDITEKVTLKAERMRANHLASIGELAAGVAHEINNPINGIINYAQILRNKAEKGSRVQDISERIIKEGERISFIVRSLLSFARERKEEKVPVHISEVLHETLSLTAVHLKKNAVDVTIGVSKGLPRIKAHPQQMQQVFLNIINNARYALNEKYPQAHPDKIFTISGEEKEIDGRPYVRLVFEDHGTGIPSHAIGKVIEPFYTTKPLSIGTGLGLSISHGIVIDHGGTMDIDSREGMYTRVILHLPAYQE